MIDDDDDGDAGGDDEYDDDGDDDEWFLFIALDPAICCNARASLGEAADL